MAFIPVESVLSAQLVYLTPGGSAENTLYFFSPNEITNTLMLTLGAQLADWWSDNLAAQTPDSVSLSVILIRDLTTQSSPSIEYSLGLPIVGTNTNAVLPSNVTMSITFSTGLTGRSYRGRNYIVGLRELAVSGDTVDPSIVSAYVTAYRELLDWGTEIDLTWVVVSRYHNNAPRSAGVPTPIIGVSSDGIVDSQRRRLAGRGR